MTRFGFLRVAACSPEVRPADIDYNVSRTAEAVRECISQNVDIAVFPELGITGYSCGDLFDQTLLIDKAQQALDRLCAEFHKEGIAFVVGAPIRSGHRLYNCAVVIQGGSIKGIVPKTHLPNYGEFYERRWFSPGTELDADSIHAEDAGETAPAFLGNIPFGTDLLFDIGGTSFGIEICEDLWVPIPPSSSLAMAGASIILNLSATNELIGKHAYTLDLIKNQSARCRCAYVYASAGFGESSTDLAFAGNCIIAENGTLLAESERFTVGAKTAVSDIDAESLQRDRMHFKTFGERTEIPAARHIHLGTPFHYPETDGLLYGKLTPTPFVDNDADAMEARCDEISSIQAWGLAVRLRAINCSKAVIGISGGLDSTLALLVTVKAFDMLGLDRKGIVGITMPGFGTTERTKGNADKLMELLGVTQREIPIGEAVKQHFSDIGHNPEVRDVTYENSQARERTQILMDVANQVNGIVIGTGDLSELALGWCTYNGDQMSMYSVNDSIPKTLVKYLVEGYAREAAENGKPELAAVLRDIIQTPISPELLPPTEEDEIEQKTEDLVGPYELHDFFLFHMLRHGSEPKKILFLAQKAFGDRYSEETLRHWLRNFYRRFFAQQFKRSCMPDGVKAGSVCLSPRGDWRMPSDASARLWLKELED